MQKKTLRVQKTARYFLLGEPGPEIKECWFVLHGYAQSAASFIKRFAPLQHPKRLFIAPEGLHRFYRNGVNGKTGASWMTSDDRLDDIIDYLGYLNQLMDLIKQDLPSECIFFICGFSQGGATAVRWVQDQPKLFTRGILWGAAFPPDLQLEKLSQGPPWWCFTGNNDPYFTVSTVLSQQKETLMQILPEAKFFNFEGGHEITESALLELGKMLS